MLGAVFFVTSRGEVVLSRAFREGFGVRAITDAFRDEIITTRLVDRSPVNIVDQQVFAHLRYENLYVVGVARADVNCFLILQVLMRLVQIVKDYYGRVDELALKDNFVVLQEVLDEAVDFGYPQNTESDLLRAYVTADGDVAANSVKRAKDAEKITIKATGKLPWRLEGIVYRENEIFLDVIEEVNVLLSSGGEVLQREVVGRIVAKAFLSGMPECQLTLNDNPGQQTTGEAGVDGTVALDDISFHSCVRLSSFANDRKISFVPPDGDFVLLRYRSTSNVKPPMRVAYSRAKEVSKTRLEIDFHLQCDIVAEQFATGVVVRVPCPTNTANVRVRVDLGKAKYDATQQAIVWKIKKLQGQSATAFSAEVNMIATTIDATEKIWGRPPISIAFSTDTFTVSGLKVTQLQIVEPRMNYTARKWIRYNSNGGQYQCRL